MKALLTVACCFCGLVAFCFGIPNVGFAQSNIAGAVNTPFQYSLSAMAQDYAGIVKGACTGAPEDGRPTGKPGNFPDEVRCQSTRAIALSCTEMAQQAVNFRQIMQSGKSSYKEILSDIDTDTVSSPGAFGALRLAASSPPGWTSSELLIFVFNRCVSVAGFRKTTAGRKQ